MKPWIKSLDASVLRVGRYSQSCQDELLEIIFNNIGTRNATPFCVEFGFNSDTLVGGSGANIARLVLEKGWDSLLLDGKHENHAISLYRKFLTSANICQTLEEYNVPKEPEYVSIDVDSADLWLFNAVVQQYRAMVFSVEYNAHFPISASITFPNDPGEHWQGDRGYGASLKALNTVAKSHGYSLLWVVPGLDAVFIRNDLINDGSDEIIFPFEKWTMHTSMICHPPLKNPSRAAIFMDYGVYLSTDGDIEASRREALPLCKKILLDNC